MYSRTIKLKQAKPIRLKIILAITLILLAASLFGSAIAQASYNEAPMLAERVAAGQLPPVEERLPVRPAVVEPLERIGEYGGTWRRALRGGGDQHNFIRTIGYHNLVGWNPEWTEVVPHVVESFEISEDAKTFTFRLREGMRWSDGHPFTADDILFWYEDVFMNEELTPGRDPLWSVADEPVVVEKVDDYTVVFRFVAPNSMFIEQIAYGFGAPPTLYPRHYLEQFHINYNPDGIDALIAAEPGAHDWVSLFNTKVSPTWVVTYWQNPDLPTLHPWVLTNAYGDTTRVVAERNPYYWKVDPEGNQLPYIDRVAYDQLDDSEVILLRAMSGDIDYQLRHLDEPRNRAVLFDNMERGDYRIFEVNNSQANSTVIYLNLTHRDPVKREIFQNKDFRVGLSYAIDRQEIIDLVFVGQGEPWQAAPRPESPYYHERLATQYTEHNLELANEHLDRAGYSQRDAEGFRLGPDGQRITFVVLVTDGVGRPDVMELVQFYWREVGIDAYVRPVDRSLMTTMLIGNEHDAYIWDSPGGLADAITDPRGFFPYNLTVIFIAPEWARWYMDPTSGEEPPEEIRRQMALYDSLNTLVNSEERREGMMEVLEIAADQFYSIGIRMPPPGFGIAKNNFRNIPDPLPMAGPLWHPSPISVQFFFDTSGE